MHSQGPKGLTPSLGTSHITRRMAAHSLNATTASSNRPRPNSVTYGDIRASHGEEWSKFTIPEASRCGPGPHGDPMVLLSKEEHDHRDPGSALPSPPSGNPKDSRTPRNPQMRAKSGCMGVSRAPHRVWAAAKQPMPVAVTEGPAAIVPSLSLTAC